MYFGEKNEEYFYTILYNYELLVYEVGFILLFLPYLVFLKKVILFPLLPHILLLFHHAHKFLFFLQKGDTKHYLQ